jgi:beta-glucosidase
MNPYSFPDDFVWGVATSAYQIEGGVDEGGRGKSIWDTFAELPGRILDGSDASVACDHYHRWPEDVRLLEWLGVDAYRFSIAWPRVMPEGRGSVNEAGLDFYDALVDALLKAGIRPFVTLYHWDLPQKLQDEGGWATRATAESFAEYSAAVGKRLGDRVSDWVTHNEPWCASVLGHGLGEHAPGHRDPTEALRVAHHLLLSHGLSMNALRQVAPGAEVGIVLNLTPAEPATRSKGDIDAARWFDGFFNRWFLDPLFRGRYPEDSIVDRVRQGHLNGPDLAFVQDGDFAVIQAPMDFLGVNYYSRAVMQRSPDGKSVGVQVVPGEGLTDMGWEVYPRGLHELLTRIHSEYRPPKIYITENGAAYGDSPDATGRIADRRRVDYHRSHLQAAHRALAEGVPLAGYFAWSMLDNFEWAHGYERRFGLCWVDFATQARTPKDSARWYREVIANRGVDESALTRT